VINDLATGYKVAHVLDSKVPRQEDKLVACLTDNYAARTGMKFHENSITRDMTKYHGFYEIAPDTPGAIIETGFLYLDRAILTLRADLVAQGIVDGLMCYLNARSAL
jgi:N-acetylmuramoyl-L-alanine amidase